MLVRVSFNLIVLYSADIQASCRFYSALGLAFNREKHGNGPEHYAASVGDVVFEIYPASAPVTADAPRLGFSVSSVDEVVADLRRLGAGLVAGPQASAWGRRAVLKDPDGYRIEISQPGPRASDEQNHA